MAILYILTTKTPTDNVSNWPPQLVETEWFENFKNRSVLLSGATQKRRHTVRMIYFKDLSEATEWFSINRITDSALISLINEWETTHNITHEEQWHELPDYSSGIPGLFS